MLLVSIATAPCKVDQTRNLRSLLPFLPQKPLSIQRSALIYDILPMVLGISFDRPGISGTSYAVMAEQAKHDKGFAYLSVLKHAPSTRNSENGFRRESIHKDVLVP